MYSEGKEVGVEDAYKQAVKSDDALVPTHLWDDWIWGAGLHLEDRRQAFVSLYSQSPLDSMRSAFLRYWRRLVCQSFTCYLRDTYGNRWKDMKSGHTDLQMDLHCGRDCLTKVATADWWEWRGGSTLLFWRWHPEFRTIARDGHPVWV